MNHTAVPLSSLFQIGSSKRVLKSQWKEYGVPFYRGREVTRLSLDGFVDNELFISEEHYTELAAKSGVPNAGDIVITAIGTIGNSYVVQENDRFYFKDASILWMKKKSEVSSQFVNLWLKSPFFFEQLDHGNGATVDTLTIQKLQNIKINLPDILEQQRIVSLLVKAFEAIALARANSEKNQQNARILFNSYRQKVLTQKKEGWQEKPLSDLCDIKHGFAFKSEYFTNNGDYVLLTPGNFYESGGYRDRGEKQKYYCGKIPDGFVLEPEALLIAMTEQAAGLLGSPIIVPSKGKYLHNQRLGLVTSKTHIPWLNEFFFHVFNTESVRQAIHESATGAKVRHTSPSKIGEVIVAFPTTIEEQKKISDQLNDFQSETQHLESLYQRKIDALDELKQSLLHQAFSGKL